MGWKKIFKGSVLGMW